MSWRIGIDTGGTFTDLTACESGTGRVVLRKVHSTPDNPGRALVAGVLALANRAGIALRDITMIVHGTTVSTNAVLEERGARVAVLTTRGFRDVLRIGRQNRPRLYDLRARRPRALVPRSHILEINERLAHDGSTLVPLDEASIDRAIATLRTLDAEVVVVALLHSYRNPSHEQRVAERVAAALDLPVILSHEVTRTHGEFERFSTAVINGFVQPVIANYLSNLRSALRDVGIGAPLFVMKSSGGVGQAEMIARRGVDTLLSGPAGGVVSGAALGRQCGYRHLITADVGGTSFDVSVIRDGEPTFAQSMPVCGLTVQAPMIDIHTIGAGGGSIGWIDAGGALRVGPQSAGAAPGPACYARGGEHATLTDANLVLGRLASDSRLAGGMTLDLDAARRAIRRLAGPLGLDEAATAEGMLRIANAAMTAAIRRLTVERGYDPRDFALCAFGGAGPLHAVELAAEMGIPRVLIPLSPGVFSAHGLLTTDLREEQVRSVLQPLDDVFDQLPAVFEEMRHAMAQHLGDTCGTLTRRLRMRYAGQGHDLSIALNDAAWQRDDITQTFHAEHHRMYGYAFEDSALEVVAAWASLSVAIQRPPAAAMPPATDVKPVATRACRFAGTVHDTPVYDRDTFGSGVRIIGPAVIEQSDTTSIIPPEWSVTVDAFGNLLVERASAAGIKRVVPSRSVTCESV